MERRTFKKRPMKRKRQLPYRKWSDYETTILVDYIKENEFEKPNGRIFYQTFVQTFHMNIEWTLVKNKIRNLKTLYEKALSWQRSDAAQNIPDGETVQSIINRICPFFDSLNEVFGGKINNMDQCTATPSQYNSSLEIQDSQNAVFKSSYSAPSSPSHFCEQEKPVVGSITVNDNITKESASISAVNSHQTSIQPENIKAVENTPNKSEPSQNHNACDCLMEIIKMMSSYQREQSEYQKSRLELEHKKFDFEKEKAIQDRELRQREIEKNERLQVLEIESKERIALKELEYKYKRL